MTTLGGTRTVVGSHIAEAGRRASGREVLRLLAATSRPLAWATAAWAVATAVAPAAVVVALGVVVGEVPAAAQNGLGSPDGQRLVVALVVAAGLYAFSLVLDPVGSAIGIAVRTRITGALQGRLLHAVSQPVGVAHLEDGDVLDRLARAEGRLTGMFPGDAPVTWAGSVATQASGWLACGVVAVYEWWVGLALLVMWVVVRRLMLRQVIVLATEHRGQTTAMRRAGYFAALGTRAQAAKEIRVFGLDGFVADRYASEYGTAIDSALGGMRRLHRRALGCLVLVAAALVGALLVIGADAHDRGIGLAAIATLLPMLAVTMSAGSVTFDDMTVAWTMSGLPDVEGLERDLGREAAPPGGARDPAGLPRDAIRFDDVSFRYPGRPDDVLAGVDLELVAGTSTAVVGVNGAGKTTLVGLLSRLRDPVSGRVLVDGTDARELDPARWQRQVAVVPQEPVHYPASAFDNVAYGAWEHRDDVDGVHAAAVQAGFGAVVDTLSDGWDTVLTPELPGGVDLSGGQWQRLALARALFATRHGARVLVLDEPTAALDVRGEAEFYARFLDITAGLTTVVISHRFSTVRRADTICVLDGGRISERGTHDELVALGGTYAQMYEVQAARFRERRAR
ncbi:MAG: ABC transporter ATP-binding protein [Pseudonocardiaceae bacterium]|nr:MAG: ABC transporter ATP-binding protein [Pseudonocardiaceae bacterium]